MVSVAEGLRMMQGGVDRTGFAKMAEGLGNPGMDLIAARRAAAAEAEAIAEYERKQAERDAEFRDELDKIIQNRGDETGTDLNINDTAMSKFGGASLLPLLLGKPGVPATALGLGALGVYDKFTNQIPMIDERLQEADPEGFEEMMEDPGESFLYNVRPMFSLADGGPVSVGMDDNKRTLRISEDDRFIEAEQMSTGDTELYNYLVGGEIMPGLSFELGVMDDAVMEPGMRSPDDLKFFNIKKTF